MSGKGDTQAPELAQLGTVNKGFLIGPIILVSVLWA